ncbi:hypothetical protein [Pseudalkalibacillus sp. JSM 102089]|uniref:hypothetical protein n=1 Tax=Pseudalkalibacillus sp. JSM 102089 TaxID=3229856 RepID=UPI003526B7D2
MKHRKIQMNKNYIPLPYDIGDEVFRNGFFHFNISRIVEHIQSGILEVELDTIEVKDWFKHHLHSRINEEYLPTVDVNKPIIQAEIRPNMYEIIDGNHRIEKAYRENIPTIQSYKLKGEQLLSYFTEKQRYVAYVEYWNLKIKDHF